MSKTLKGTLIAGAVLICLGLVLVLAIGFSSGWDVTDSQWEKKEYVTTKGTTISDIDLNLTAGRLNIEFYRGSVIKVEYSENKNVTTQCEVEGQTLKIQSIIHWHVQFLWFNKIPETTVYIPRDTQLNLKLQMDAGTVSVGEGQFNNVNIKMEAGVLSFADTNCNNFDLNMNAGTMKVSKIQCSVFKVDINAGTLNVAGLQSHDITLDLSAGTAKLGVIGKKSEYNIRAEVSAGSCNVRNQNGTTLKTISIDVSAGSANLSFDD